MDFENKHVHDIYAKIARSFDTTRVAHWSAVKQFLNEIKSHSLILDNGCGNGKYQGFPRPDIHWVGNDVCNELLHIAASKHDKPSYLRANGLNLPYKSNWFDACISVAVLHHLSSPERRQQFLAEINRVLIPGGRALITVWAAEQNHDDARKTKWTIQENGDAYIPWNTSETQRYYHLFSRQEITDLCSGNEWSHVNISYECDNWVIVLEKKV
jgi:ubiquinone/menaquinone biosynthesis C-methylase UbiE